MTISKLYTQLVTHNAGTDSPRLPSPDEVREVLGFVPLVEAYFRRARSEMADELRDLFTTHGLTARHGAVIGQLVAEQSLSVSDLARRMGVSLPTTSELVGDLDRAGLAQRQEDPTNRRRTLVSLAEEHRQVVERFVATRAAPLLHVLERLSPRDRAGFVNGLRQWAAEVEST